MPAILKGLSGSYAGSQLEVGAQPIIIGRDPAQANLVIPENQTEVSGRHASIWFDAARQVFMLVDTSTNGTYLMSGERIMRDQPYPLQSGMRFYLSNTGTSFEVEVTGNMPAFSGVQAQPLYSQPVREAAPQYYSDSRGHAGFWKRVVASLIDWLVLIIPLGILKILFSVQMAFTTSSRFAEIFYMSMMLVVIASLTTWLYFALMESSKYQGTVGKIAMGIKVTDAYGQPVSFWRATGRHFSKIITSIIPLGIGYMLAGWTERRQAIHDMIAGCLVENK